MDREKLVALRAEGKCVPCLGTGMRHPQDPAKHLCHDCGAVYELYMVRDDIWNAAWPEYRETRIELMKQFKGTLEDFRTHRGLCFVCLAKRLGRDLRPDDFDLKINCNHGIMLGLVMADK